MANPENANLHRFTLADYDESLPISMSSSGAEASEADPALLQRLEDLPPVVANYIRIYYITGLCSTPRQILIQLRSKLPMDSFGVDEDLIGFYIMRHRVELDKERDAAVGEMEDGLLREQMEICRNPAKGLHARIANNLATVLDRHWQTVVDGEKEYSLSDIVTAARALEKIGDADPLLGRERGRPPQPSISTISEGSGAAQGSLSDRAGRVMKRILEFSTGSEGEAKRQMKEFAKIGERMLEEQE